MPGLETPPKVTTRFPVWMACSKSFLLLLSCVTLWIPIFCSESEKYVNDRPCSLRNGDCTLEKIFSKKSTPTFLLDEENKEIFQSHNLPYTQRAKTYCYNDMYKVIYFMIPKSGSTTFSRYVNRQLRPKYKKSKNGIIDAMCNQLWGMQKVEIEISRYTKYFRMTFVRDPIRHFLSGYGEAGIYNQYQKDHQTKYQNIIDLKSVKYGKGNFDPIREAVDNKIAINYLIMPFERRKQFMYIFIQDSLSGDYCNRHCMPQSNWVFAWNKQGEIIQLPEFVGRLEQMEDSWREINVIYEQKIGNGQLPYPSQELNVAHNESAGLGEVLWRAEWSQNHPPKSFCEEGGLYSDCKALIDSFSDSALLQCRTNRCRHKVTRLPKDMSKELMSSDAGYIMANEKSGELTKMICAYVMADYFAFNYTLPEVCLDEQVLEEFFYYREVRDRKTGGRSP